MKQYIDDQDDKSSPLDHEHAQYVKRNVLANVAFTGSFYDLKDIPDLQDAITKEELEAMRAEFNTMKADFDKTFLECRDVTEKYRTGRSATLRLSQLILRLFAQLL